MCYEKTKEVNFGGVTLKKLMDCRSHKTTQRSVKSFCSAINSIESVYFIELTKYDRNESSNEDSLADNTFGVKRKVRKQTKKRVKKARRQNKKKICIVQYQLRSCRNSITILKLFQEA